MISRTLKVFLPLTWACLLLAQQVQAGTAEVVNADGQRMSFEYAPDKMRVNVSEDDSIYMILRDEGLYSVNNSEGKIIVIDASKAFSMFSNMAQASAPDMVANEFISLKPTGKMEEHAGITGEVFELTYRNNDGKEEQSEVVLTNDKRARNFLEAMHLFATTLARASGKDYEASTDDIQARLAGMDKGVLRYGDDMSVTALTDDSVASERFVLPAEPMDISSLGAILGGVQATPGAGGAQGQAPGQAEGGLGGLLGAMGSALGGGSEETGEEAGSDEDAAAEDTSATGEIGKALGRIFGN